MRNWKEVIFAFVRRQEWLSLMNHSLSPFGSVYALIFKVKNNVFVGMIIKTLSQFYRMNEQRLGIELPIDTRVMEDKIPPLWNHSH